MCNGSKESSGDSQREYRLFVPGIVKKTEEGAVLTGSLCRICGKKTFPPTEFCPNCLSEDLEEWELSGTGTLYTYTITRLDGEHFPAPYPHGIIRIPEDEVSLVAPLIVDEGSEPRIGDTMEPVFERLWTDEDGTEIYGYKYRKCGDAT